MTLQINPRTLQEHSMCPNSVPCAHFRVSLHDYIIHSSRCIDFAGFGLVGFRFFISNGEAVASFCQWDYNSFTVLWDVREASSVTYAAICCLPRTAIMCHHERRSKEIFRPHTNAFACWRCACLIPWIAGVYICSGVCKSGHHDEHAGMQVSHEDRQGAHEQRNEYILHAKKTS
jgi:hypothetical protein